MVSYKIGMNFFSIFQVKFSRFKACKSFEIFSILNILIPWSILVIHLMCFHQSFFIVPQNWFVILGRIYSQKRLLRILIKYFLNVPLTAQKCKWPKHCQWVQRRPWRKRLLQKHNAWRVSVAVNSASGRWYSS